MAAPTKPASYHFILTIQRDTGMVSTRAGVWTAPSTGGRRDEALTAIANQAFPGELPNIVILNFSLEPNDL